MQTDINLTKEAIISLLEEQLNSLIQFYEQQLTDLRNENNKFKNDYLSLKKEFDQKISNRDDNVINSKDKDGGAKSPISNLKSLSIKEKLYQLKRISTLEECSDALAEINASNLKSFQESDIQMLISFFRKILYLNSDKPLVKKLTYKLILSIVKSFAYKKEFEVFLKTNSNRLNEMAI